MTSSLAGKWWALNWRSNIEASERFKLLLFPAKTELSMSTNSLGCFLDAGQSAIQISLMPGYRRMPERQCRRRLCPSHQCFHSPVEKPLCPLQSESRRGWRGQFASSRELYFPPSFSITSFKVLCSKHLALLGPIKQLKSPGL